MVKSHILLVDDEPKLIRLVREVLTATGFEILTASRGSQAIEMVALEQPDLLLLDIVLADEIDGFEVARRVREFSNIPIIILTAKAREIDLLHGFDAGADDYITKPFSSKELLARVRAALKRVQKSESVQSEGQILCGKLKIDTARRCATLSDNEVRLTRTEYNLLYELAVHRNQVVLHEQLLTAVWGTEYRDDLEYLRAYVHYLRQKLEIDSSNPQMIVTCPGVGYMLVCPEE